MLKKNNTRGEKNKTQRTDAGSKIILVAEVKTWWQQAHHMHKQLKGIPVLYGDVTDAPIRAGSGATEIAVGYMSVKTSAYQDISCPIVAW